MRRALYVLSVALAFVAGASLQHVVPALAGVTVDNVYVSLHRNPGDTEAVYELRLHRGNQSIDTVSGEFGRQEFFQLKASALSSQADFEAAADGILGGWYTNLSTARKAEFRSAFIDAC